MSILDKARVIGTYNQINRAAQYTREDPRELLRAVNEAWTKIRTLEKELGKKDAAIAELRDKLRRSQIVNVTLTSIITGLAFKGIELLFQLLR
jgi:septal ring factor EnvC (AmiA/AmiB activator)